jgi:uncharacterized repeat protein (TIGR01451 family)
VGDVAVIGAPGTSPTAYVFRRSGGIWTFGQQLFGTETGEEFGTSVALSGSDLAVGSPTAYYSSPPSGSVYTFHDDAGSYSLTQRIACPTSVYSARCGTVVALSGDSLLASAPLAAYSAGPGSASLFARSGGQWALSQQLLPSDSGPQVTFGTGVALAGTQVIVGAPDADAAAHDSGAAYVFGPATSDLSLAMTASPLVVSQGDPVTVSLVLTNGGPAGVVGTAVAINLEPGLVFSAAGNGNCNAAPGGAICAFGSVAPGATGSIDFLAVAAAVGTSTSTATVARGGPSAQAMTTVSAANADVALTMTTPTAARRGQNVEYWLYAENAGPASAAAVRVSHPTPAGLVLESVFGPSCTSLPCDIPRIAVTSTYSIRLTYRVPDNYSGPEIILNTGSVTAVNVDPVPGNNTASGSTPLEVDNTSLRFYTLAPCRLVDTRDAALGGPLPLTPGPALYTAGAGTCGIPYSARALALNVTVTEPTTDGLLNLYPHDATPPLASFLNYRAGQTRSKNGVIGLDASSRFVVQVGQPAGSVHVIVDVVGYFQ